MQAHGYYNAAATQTDPNSFTGEDLQRSSRVDATLTKR